MVDSDALEKSCTQRRNISASLLLILLVLEKYNGVFSYTSAVILFKKSLYPQFFLQMDHFGMKRE